MGGKSLPDPETAIGLLLAGAILLGWAGGTAWAVLLHRWTPWDALLAPLLVLVLAWANVGLFIVAHDAMHGALVPGRPGLNRALGRLFLALYVAFPLDRMLPAHHAHHHAPGTADDPDFDVRHPRQFWPWYGAFLLRYVSWRQFACGTCVFGAAMACGVGVLNVLAFWAVPALLASLQLFAFGTFLPHRHGAPFADGHKARSTDMGFAASLLSCFHFGACHHRHHVSPHLPWWKLWAARRVAGKSPAGLNGL